MAAYPACPLFEVHPEPELYADMVGIGVIFPVGEEVVGGDGHKEIRKYPTKSFLTQC